MHIYIFILCISIHIYIYILYIYIYAYDVYIYILYRMYIYIWFTPHPTSTCLVFSGLFECDLFEVNSKDSTQVPAISAAREQAGGIEESSLQSLGSYRKLDNSIGGFH